MSGLLLSETQSGLPGHLGGVRLIEQSTDGRLFLCADLDLGVSLWKDGKVVRRYLLPSDGAKSIAMDRIRALCLSQDNSRFYVAAGLHVRCIDTERGIELWNYRPSNLYGFLQSSPRTAVLTGSMRILVSSDNNQMAVFDSEGHALAKWRANDAPLIADLHKESGLFIGSDGVGLTVWDVDERRRLARYGLNGRVFGLKVVPKSDKVVLRTEHGVSVFDLFAGRVARSFPVLPGLPYLDASQSGRLFLTGEGKGISVYTLDGEKTAHYVSQKGRAISARFDRNSDDVVLGTSDGALSRVSKDQASS